MQRRPFCEFCPTVPQQNIKPKVLVFDLGGVILPLQPKRAHTAIQALALAGGKMPFDLRTWQPLLDSYEKGEMSSADFLARVCTELRCAEGAFLAAWNAILEPIPPAHMDLLRQLSRQYRCVLLSNTNPLHMHWVERHLLEMHGSTLFNDVLEQCFLSFELGCRKPEEAIYAAVQQALGLDAASIWFIDDHPDNLQSASRAGWQTALHPANAPLIQSVERWLNIAEGD